MHDMTFCQEILTALADRQKKLRKGRRIKAVSVSLSPISHVTPKTLEETFRVMAKNTPFCKVKLAVSTLKLGITCESCKKGFMVDKPTFVCPACHGSSLNLVYQKEFTVDSIDVTAPK